jgi:carbon-monoxide dehydrogenase medium subunit
MIGVLSFGADGRIEAARIVGFGLADRPIRIDAAEAVLVGTEATDQVFGEAARLVSRAVDPPNDIHASADYRRRLAGVLTRRALVEAAASARRLAA